LRAVVGLLWVVVSATGHAEEVPGRHEVWLASPAARAQLFDAVAVRLQHHHLLSSSLNWDAWRTAYRPSVVAADGQDAIDRAFKRAFRGLDDDHSRWLGRRTARARGPAAQTSASGVPLNARLGAQTLVLPGVGLLIERPYAGGAADRAGILRGDVLVRIGGRDLRDLPAHQMLTVVSERLTRPLLFSVALRQGVPKPHVLQPSLNGGTDALRPHARPVPGRQAVRLWLPNFESGTAQAVAEALRSRDVADADALLLDLRGNPGGSVREMLQVLALFAPDARITAVVGDRVRWRSVREQVGGVTRVALAPEDEAEALGTLAEGTRPAGPVWTGPLAVLVDGRTHSAAEALAGALVREAGVPAFGVATPDNVEMVKRTSFPAGHEAWVAFAELRDSAARPLAPVNPARSHPARPHDLAMGVDAAEAAALHALLGGSPAGGWLFTPERLR
jgi:C-terminal processing protease CtpA/Prc